MRHIRLNNGNTDWPKVLALLFLVLIALIVLIQARDIYWFYFEDNPPGEFISIEVNDGLATPGGTVSISLVYDKFTTAEPELKYAWADEVLYVVANPPQLPSADPGRIIISSFVLDVPATLNPSDYFIRGELQYPVNPKAVRTVDFEVGPFNIVSPEEYYELNRG